MKEVALSKEVSIDIVEDVKEAPKRTPFFATLGRVLQRTGGRYLWLIWTISALSGALLTTQAYIFGQAMEKLGEIEFAGASASPKILSHFLILGGTIFVVFSLVRVCSSFLVVHAVNEIRCDFFRSILKQDISFHDSQASGAISSQLAEDSAALQTGILLMPEVAMKIGQFFAGIIWAFCASWFISLILLAFSPFVIIGGLIQGLVLSKVSAETPFADAFGRATDAISAIRTTISLTAETALVSRFEEATARAANLEKRKGYATAFAVAYFVSFVFCVIYGFGFYMAEIQLEAKKITVADFSTAFFAFIFGAMALGEIFSMIPQVIQGLAGAHRMLDLIDRKPAVISGEIERELAGEVEFRNVSFAYPTRKDDIVLKDFSVKIKAGETVALVGPSGCGKSTIISLLERFYDPLEGEILVDGVPITSLNLESLRSQISLVSQEPVLFNLTIKENILLGGEGDLQVALDMANAGFVSQFSDGIDTMVGEKGEALSGGQKQRIAIARAMIGQPRILLLDEATSALDSESEAVVQQALDKVVTKSNCTTIMIAHRLSTVKNADRILVIDAGKIVEEGSHYELVKLNGRYASMVATQSIE